MHRFTGWRHLWWCSVVCLQQFLNALCFCWGRIILQLAQWDQPTNHSYTPSLHWLKQCRHLNGTSALSNALNWTCDCSVHVQTLPSVHCIMLIPLTLLHIYDTETEHVIFPESSDHVLIGLLRCATDVVFSKTPYNQFLTTCAKIELSIRFFHTTHKTFATWLCVLTCATLIIQYAKLLLTEHCKTRQVNWLRSVFVTGSAFLFNHRRRYSLKWFIVAAIFIAISIRN